MLVLSDTHGTEDARLTPHLRERVASADRVVHAGDFTTQTVLDAFEELAGELVAVRGNSDAPEVGRRLPGHRVAERFGRRFLVVHGHRHDPTSLSVLARQESVDAVVTGHTHRPGVDSLDGLPVVNPGSHADPRGNRAGYATLERRGGEVVCELRGTGGETVRSVTL